MCEQDRIFSVLTEHAKDLRPIRGSRHAAAIVYKKRIISIGHNSLKTHPMMLEYGRRKGSLFLHAEIDAIIKALKSFGPEILTKCDIYVLRLTRGIRRGNSKPCEGCQRAIDAFGFKGVYHT